MVGHDVQRIIQKTSNKPYRSMIVHMCLCSYPTLSLGPSLLTNNAYASCGHCKNLIRFERTGNIYAALYNLRRPFS